MRNHRSRERRTHGILGSLGSSVSRLRAHPIRSTCFAALSLLLFWVVLTKSLPYALATANPDLALVLNPNNPAALMAKAESVHTQLLQAKGVIEEAGSKKGDPAKSGDIANLPKDKGGSIPGPKLDDLRNEIRRLRLPRSKMTHSTPRPSVCLEKRRMLRMPCAA